VRDAFEARGGVEYVVECGSGEWLLRLHRRRFLSGGETAILPASPPLWNAGEHSREAMKKHVES
jgi:hypothetical protein